MGAGLSFEDKDLLVRYLLGDLPQTDRQRLERELLADDGAWEALTEAENDLVDSYACGELSEEQRQQFKENFLNSPQRKEQLAVATMLMSSALREKIVTAPMNNEKKPTSWWESVTSLRFIGKPALGPAWAAAGLGLAAVAMFLGWQNWSLRSQVENAQLAQTQLQGQLDDLRHLNNSVGAQENDAGSHSQSAPLKASPRPVASILLTPGLSRELGSSSPGNQLVVPAGTALIILKLDLERDAYRHYDVVIETVEGKATERVERLASQSTGNGGRCVAVQLPSPVLSKGDYVITLYGLEPGKQASVVNSYSLSVVR
jgi:hypothetical protein